MINLSNLNKLILIGILLTILFVTSVLGEDEDQPIDLWEDQVIKKSSPDTGEDIVIERPTISEDINKIIIKIDEDKIEDNAETVIGIFDPAENNFNLDMWSATDGEDIKKVLNRINKLKLSQLSEDLLFRVLFTNSYSPKKNLSADEFLKIKVDWLIKRKRIKDLEILFMNNVEVGKNIKATNFLINEYLSSLDIKSACDKINFIDKKFKNIYLEKFVIYCLISNNEKEQAQLIFDLLKERGFQDNFFEDKINFLLGVAEKTNQKILDNNLLNFYLSYITHKNFEYSPTDQTNKYIWRFMFTNNLIKTNSFEDDKIILTYERAAANNSFDKDEIFNIYLKIAFNFNELVKAEEIYKNLPSYKARPLLYQSILLTDDTEKKIQRAFLLKELFIKDKIFEVYNEELSTILKSLNPNEIPEGYDSVISENLNEKYLTNKVKFDNDILHKSRVIKHFLDENVQLSRTEKDFKIIYKKIKKNRKYFISIKDIIVLESLKHDGVLLPKSLDFEELTSELTVPQNLEELVRKNQIGLVMLKIVEIIGEDNVYDIDPETIYFINQILNQLNLKKIRNNILSEVLPARI